MALAAGGLQRRGRTHRILPETCCGLDIDDLFAYSTTKQVSIRDARLGLLQYTFLGAIVAYIGVYQMAYQLGYLTFYDPDMTVRLSLQEPVQSNCNPRDNSCHDNLPPFRQAPYCCVDGCAKITATSCSCPWRKAFQSYKCKYLDGTTASIVMDNSALVSTMVHTYNQHLNTTCQNGTYGCTKLWETLWDAQEFILGIENFTLLIDHSVHVDRLGLSESSALMTGYLYVNGARDLQRRLCRERPDALAAPSDPRGLTDAAPCYLPPSHPEGSSLDFFSVGTLLAAAGVDLDEASIAGSAHSARYEGLTMTVHVDYHNTAPWRGRYSGGEVRYTYNIETHVKNPYKYNKEVWVDFPAARHLESRHGLLVEVVPSGKLAGFSGQTLLVNLTASLTLLAVATVITNTLAMYILKRRKYYAALIYQRSHDFSEVSMLDARSDEELRALLAQHGLSTSGSRIEQISRLLDNGWAATGVEAGQAAPAHAAGQQPLPQELMLPSSTHGAPLLNSTAGAAPSNPRRESSPLETPPSGMGPGAR